MIKPHWKRGSIVEETFDLGLNEFHLEAEQQAPIQLVRMSQTAED